MKTKRKFALFILRFAMGWLCLYAGVSKILDSSWSAGDYLSSAKVFPGFFPWLGSSAILPVTNFLNEWGLILIGISLLVGFFVRISSIFGLLLMILYYLPIIDPVIFPKVGHGYVVDEHIIYALVFLVFIVFNAGRYWGIDSYRR